MAKVIVAADADNSTVLFHNSAIPVASVMNLRRGFPGKTLVFEIELAASDCWAGLAHLASAFAQSGATLRLLRCTQAGLISCVVADGGGDLWPLAESLSSAQGISVTGWTTRIDYS